MAFLCCCTSFARSAMPDLSLSLVSSSNTFLNGLVVDTDTRKPVYSIDTVESLTSITRKTAPTAARRGSRAPSHTGSGASLIPVASVQWPERSPHIVPLRPGAPRITTSVNPKRDQDGVRVYFNDGSVAPLPRFLKRRSQALYVDLFAPFASVTTLLITNPSPLCPVYSIYVTLNTDVSPHIYIYKHSAGTCHKFRIPGYPATFKWKRSGRKYQVSLVWHSRSSTPPKK
jgi:hypothetical protein